VGKGAGKPERGEDLATKKKNLEQWRATLFIRWPLGHE